MVGGRPDGLRAPYPTPRHFEQAAQLVTEDMISESVICGSEPEPHREMLRQFAEAGYDEVYVSQIGGNFEAFFDFHEKESLPTFC